MWQPPILVYPGASVLWVHTPPTGYVLADASMLRRELAQHQPGIALFREHKGENKPIPTGALIEAHGRRVDRIVYDMTISATAYLPGPHGGGELLAACAIPVAIPPVYDEDVDTWLGLLAGSRADRLRDWLATVRDLRHPTAALYLQGPKSLGKGLLAAGVAKLWGRAVTSYVDILGNFNGALKTCPVVFLDEGAPISPTGSASFRSLISESERALTEKYRPAATLRGCVRLIIAANNADALRIREDLSPEDEEAIGERILHIDCQTEARDFLVSIGGRAATTAWMEDADGAPGRFPRHLAWLAQTRRVIPGHRFLVHGEAGDWLRRAALRGGIQQDVLCVVAMALSSSLSHDPPAVYCPGDNTAHVSPERLHALWPELLRTARVPHPAALGRALTALAPGPAVRHRSAGHIPRRVLSGDRILEASRMLGVGDPDEIAERLRGVAPTQRPVNTSNRWGD